jgi:hypothetical protein
LSWCEGFGTTSRSKIKKDLTPGGAFEWDPKSIELGLPKFTETNTQACIGVCCWHIKLGRESTWIFDFSGPPVLYSHVFPYKQNKKLGYPL